MGTDSDGSNEALRAATYNYLFIHTPHIISKDGQKHNHTSAASTTSSAPSDPSPTTAIAHPEFTPAQQAEVQAILDSKKTTHRGFREGFKEDFKKYDDEGNKRSIWKRIGDSTALGGFVNQGMNNALGGGADGTSGGYVGRVTGRVWAEAGEVRSS
ncbi:hypothetical protein MRB53_039896 [Persea americana]|nr:hypothetical protein MRB53_039896 [Persea americana]